MLENSSNEHRSYVFLKMLDVCFLHLLCRMVCSVRDLRSYKEFRTSIYITFANAIIFLQHIIHISVSQSKGAKVSNRYNQVPHLAQNTNGKVTNSQ